MATKRCTSCERVLLTTEFYKLSKAPDGLSWICKDCDRRKSRDRYVSKFQEKYASPEQRAVRNAAKLRYRYGLTRAEIEARVVEQGGCAVCHTDSPGGKNWHVDHDHSCCPGDTTCGECVRGILCGSCNRALGLFDDNIETLRSAIAYLLLYQTRENIRA